MKAIRVLLTIVLLTGAIASANAQFDFGFEDTRQPWEQFKLNAKTMVKLDFRNASVDAIIHTLSQASGIAIVKDPTLTGGVTLQSPKQQKLTDAFAMFNAVLGLKGFDLKKEGNFLVIRSRGQGGRNSGFNMQSMMNMDPSAAGGAQPQNTIKVYPLKYASATQVARVVNEVYALQNATTMMSNAGGGGGPMPMMGGPGMPYAPEDGEDVPGGGQRGGRGLMQIMGQGGMGGGMMGGMGGMMGGMGGFQGFGRRGATSGSTVRASADEYSNSVIVNAPTSMQDQIGMLINQLDKETDQPQTSRVFKLEYAAAADLTTVVQNVLNYNASRGRGYTGTSGGQGGGFNPFMMGRGGGNNTNVAAGSVVAETRTNSLVVTTISENMAMAEKVIKELDKPVTYENRAFVVTLKNAKADVVSQLLNQSFGSTRGSTGTNNRTTTTGTGSNRTNNRTTGNTGLGTSGLGRSPSQAQAPERMAEPLGPQDAMAYPDDQENMQIAQGGMFGLFGGQGFGQGGGGTSRQTNTTNTSGFDANGRRINLRDLAGDMTAIPDVNTNSVIIVTSPQNRELIESILEQLDKIPEQVMIETLIVEASLDATSKLGVEWNFTSGSSTATSNYGLKADTTQPQGLRYTLTGSQYGVFLNGVKSDSRFDVLSTPRIFTSNNSQAEINISQSLPYVTNQRVDSNGNYSYSYSFMDVGIVLTVTPRITSNGYVTMEVTQTANDFVRYTDFNAPVVNQREAQTTVSVKDGDTVVLGGIIKNSLSSTVNKVPILGDIPIVGSLFRSTNNTNSKTELLVFLTPHVVRDPDEARALRERTQKELQQKTQQRLQKFMDNGDSDKPTKEVTPPVPTGGPTVRG